MLTPGPKKNKAATDVVNILQRQHEQTGRSYRQLICRYDLPRSRVLRWQANIRRGHPAIRRAGLHKPPLPALLLVVVHLQVANLHHGRYRSRGLPELCRAWSLLVPRADLRDIAARHRLLLRREERSGLQHLHWPHPGTVWAMDEAVINGTRWLLVIDIASRYRFQLLLADDLPAGRIVPFLDDLLRHHTPPLFLKRDNGPNLACQEVDICLADYGVVALNSPRRWPRYNGAVEYAQREIKAAVILLVQRTGASLQQALAVAPQFLNAKPRPCLHGASAHEIFHTPTTALAWAFTPNSRKDTKHWIDKRTEAILSTMTVCSRHAQVAARRLATETRMLDMGLIVPVQPKNVSPHFP